MDEPDDEVEVFLALDEVLVVGFTDELLVVALVELDEALGCLNLVNKSLFYIEDSPDSIFRFAFS
jgi:hypothetical protein